MRKASKKHKVRRIPSLKQQRASRGEPLLSDKGQWSMTRQWLIDHPKVQAEDLGVWVFILRQYNRGRYFTTYKEIAKRFHRSIKWAYRCVRHLKAVGALTSREASGRYNQFFPHIDSPTLDLRDDELVVPEEAE